MINEIIMKRLSYIKMLYRKGLREASESDATASFSILSFHDAVEMFLNFATQHLNIRYKREDSFMMFWDRIPNLTLRESMSEVNKRRVSVKHNGIFLSKHDIETSKIFTGEFFNQNTKNIFGIEFSEISLFELIIYSNTKEYLKEAQSNLDKNEIEKCVENSAFAFNCLLDEYKSNKRESFAGQFEFIEKINLNNGLGRNSSIHEGVIRAFQKADKNFESLQNILDILSLGLDYRKYLKFQYLTPLVSSQPTIDGYSYFSYGHAKKNWTKGNCQFLIDFVLDSALALQEIEYDIESLRFTE